MKIDWWIGLYLFAGFVGGCFVSTLVYEAMLGTSKQVAENEKICEERYAQNTFINAKMYEIRIKELEQRFDNVQKTVEHWRTVGRLKDFKILDKKIYDAIVNKKESELPGLIEAQTELIRLEKESLKADSLRNLKSNVHTRRKTTAR
jgi:hypothetical protein